MYCVSGICLTSLPWSEYSLGHFSSVSVFTAFEADEQDETTTSVNYCSMNTIIESHNLFKRKETKMILCDFITSIGKGKTDTL